MGFFFVFVFLIPKCLKHCIIKIEISLNSCPFSVVLKRIGYTW